MSGKEIRRWAWEKAKEKRWFIIAVILVGSLPAVLVTRISRNFSWPLLLGVGTPLKILTNTLALGTVFVFLRVAKGEEAKIGQIMTPFSRELFGKALLIGLADVIVLLVLNYGTGFLIRKGEEIIRESGYLDARNSLGRDGVFAIEITREMTLSNIKGNALKSLGTGLRSLLGYCVAIVWFPVDYMLFLFPEKTGQQVIREGVSLGFHSFWSIFMFQFWILLPAVGVMGLLLLIFVLLRETWFIGLAGIPLFYLLLILFAYEMIADAGFALNLSGGRIHRPAKKKRK